MNSKHRIEVSKSAAKQMNKKESLFPAWLRIIISVGLLVLVASNLDIYELLSVFSDARVDLILIFVAMAFALRIFAAYRWFVLYKCTNKSVTLLNSIKITFIANFIGQFLPGGVGIEAVRIYGMAKNTSDLAGSFTSVLIERLFGLSALVLMVFLGLSTINKELPEPFLSSAWIALATLTVFAIVLLYTQTRNWIERCLPNILVRQIEEKLGKLYYCLDLYKRQPLQLAFSAFLAILFQVFRILFCFVGALALGEEPYLSLFFVFVPIIVFVTLLPISIGGLGVREAGFVYFFSTYGVMDASSAFALSILIFFVDSLTNLIGAYFYVFGQQK